MNKKAVIIGAGPAGLTAAYEMVHRADIKPIIFEKTGDIGGIAKTKEHNGNRIDIGGHRFFSKSEWVMNWWTSIMPVQGAPAKDHLVLHKNPGDRTMQADYEQGKGPNPEKEDRVMLTRHRLSRIYYLRKFFNYPLSISYQTFKNLGLLRLFRIGLSYMSARAFPIKQEKSLQDFFINRFGSELYSTFFKDYTEKVWGVPCTEIKPEWGAQRIKGLSAGKAIIDAVKKIFIKDRTTQQKQTETSLITRFLYPKYGPGQMWETVAGIVKDKGAEIHMHKEVVGMKLKKDRIAHVKVKDTKTGKVETVEADYFISTMPVKEMFEGIEGRVPDNVMEVAKGLLYRDFVTVGMKLKKMKIKNNTDIKTLNNMIPDSWIYIQERDVNVGRMQIFNNWSPYMVSEPGKPWVGLEYFCNEDDHLWTRSDEDFKNLAVEELEQIGFIDKEDEIGKTIIRMEKAYPVYFGTYDQFDTIKEFTKTIPNLFLIGRNGMHRYNNMDHSMITARTAVDNIIEGKTDKSNIWKVNTEKVYHEVKKEK